MRATCAEYIIDTDIVLRNVGACLGTPLTRRRCEPAAGELCVISSLNQMPSNDEHHKSHQHYRAELLSLQSKALYDVILFQEGYETVE